MFLFLLHTTSVQIVIVFVKHLLRESCRPQGALQHARTQKLSARAGTAGRSIVVEYHNAGHVFTAPAEERLARERTCRAFPRRGFAEPLCDAPEAAGGPRALVPREGWGALQGSSLATRARNGADVPFVVLQAAP